MMNNNSISSDFVLNASCKGYPLTAEPCAVSALGQRGWHLLEDALAYPVAVLRRPALDHNLAWMQDFVQRKGVALAPHGKTTMSPELFRMQLQAGAWGLTFANVHQLRVGLAAGAQRAIIANQLVSDADLDGLDALLHQHPQARVWFLVDSLAQLQAPGKTTFLPYLGGERTPLNSAAIRGAFTGLEHITDRQAGTRAVLEGVTFAFRDCRDALAATGTKLQHLLAVGGGSRSDYWLKAIATALDCPVHLPVAGDFGGAFGAARLGLMAATGVGAEIATLPQIARVVDPDPSLKDAFDAGHARYRAAQTAIRSLA